MACLPSERRLRPLVDVPPTVWCAMRGVLTDIDDTLTAHGEIEPVALQALHRLAGAGWPVIAVTGRPAGWSEPMARAWPVAANVAENGGVMWRREGRRLRLDFAQDEATRRRQGERLRACAAAVLNEVPGAAMARDSDGRLTDIAIDHAEFSRLEPAQIDAVVAVMRRHGLHATVSSIHVNGWLGGHSKWTGACWAVQAVTGAPLDATRWVYVGDSTNDQPMFEHIPLSIGVANIAAFVDRLRVLPACVTRGERGQGFAEVVDALLAGAGRG